MQSIVSSNNGFQVLNIREILDFLIGDYILPNYDFYTINKIQSVNPYQVLPTLQLPRLSGNQIMELYPRFGLSDPIYKEGTPSRWIMMKNIISRLDKIGRANELLAYLFSKPRFQPFVNYFKTTSDFETFYNGIVKMSVEYINKQLYISQKRLCLNSGKYYIQPLPFSESISIPLKKIDDITSQYIKTLPDRIKSDLNNKDYDSVINKCRTLIEEILCYIIEQKGETPIDNGKVEHLQGQCRKLLKMNTDNGQDQRIIQLLKGLSTIISAISGIRNIGSDAHGVGSRRINIGEREAILVSNATQTYCEYYLSVFLSQKSKL